MRPQYTVSQHTIKFPAVFLRLNSFSYKLASVTPTDISLRDLDRLLCSRQEHTLPLTPDPFISENNVILKNGDTTVTAYIAVQYVTYWIQKQILASQFQTASLAPTDRFIVSPCLNNKRDSISEKNRKFIGICHCSFLSIAELVYVFWKEGDLYLTGRILSYEPYKLQSVLWSTCTVIYIPANLITVTATDGGSVTSSVQIGPGLFVCWLGGRGAGPLIRMSYLS
jgi:hypothetical protein